MPKLARDVIELQDSFNIVYPLLNTTTQHLTATDISDIPQIHHVAGSAPIPCSTTK
jgi:hypothetical protein